MVVGIISSILCLCIKDTLTIKTILSISFFLFRLELERSVLFYYSGLLPFLFKVGVKSREEFELNATLKSSSTLLMKILGVVVFFSSV